VIKSEHEGRAVRCGRISSLSLRSYGLPFYTPQILNFEDLKKLDSFFSFPDQAEEIELCRKCA